MTIQETTMILKVIKTAYPNTYKGMTDEELGEILDLWAMMFADDDAKIVTEAVKAMIITLKFPPTIADIKEKINLMTSSEIMTEMEAWTLVYKALCNSAYESESQFNRLPPIIQKIVGAPKQLREWGLTENLNMSVVQSNFMRSYKAMSERQEMIRRLPDSCKSLINNKKEDAICLNVQTVAAKDMFPM